MTSKDSYNNPAGAQHYLNFLQSEDGVIFRQVLYDAFADRLDSNRDQKILDAACGPGWLSAKLAENYKNIEGCDGSKNFLERARKEYPGIKFTEVDLGIALPYSDNEFDTIIMSMAAHDVEDQVKTFTELKRILKPAGKLMLTMVNPYYAYPVGVWKRGIIGRLLFRKPRLLVRPYHWFGKKGRNFTFNVALECYFYKLSEHLNHITEAGFTFAHMKDLETSDSENYNLKYRLNRFPIIVYLEFTK
jgi:ubiquinone/menaquinone biosynthesis C-methylase UbiE